MTNVKGYKVSDVAKRTGWQTKNSKKSIAYNKKQDLMGDFDTKHNHYALASVGHFLPCNVPL